MCHQHAVEIWSGGVDLWQASWRRWYVMRSLEDGENGVQNEAEYDRSVEVGKWRMPLES